MLRKKIEREILLIYLFAVVLLAGVLAIAIFCR